MSKSMSNHLREHHCLGRHVYTHGKGLGREEDLEQALLEEQLDHFFHYWEEATVMDANASL